MRSACFVFLASLVLRAQPAVPSAPTPDPGAYTRANYTKYEYRIPMRDGKRLFTSVYVPKDEAKPYPILLSRTPYSVAPYGEDNYRTVLAAEKFSHEGFIFAFQDVRGRYMSEGVFVEMTPYKKNKSGPQDVDEASDTYDTIEWLVKNVPNNNGRVGTRGISYPGFFATQSLLDAHPALKAVSPQAPMVDLFSGDDAYHNGVFYLAANFGFYSFFGKKKTEPELPDPNRRRFDFGTQDGYDFYLRMGSLANANEKFLKQESPYWNEQVDNNTYNAYWTAREVSRHMRGVKPAVLTVGGWFDAEDLQGPLKLFRAIEKQSPETDNHIVMGPWVHGGWSTGDGDRLGKVMFQVKAGEWFRDNVEFPFFLQHLKGKGEAALPKALMFETGTNRWRRFAEWPPKGAQKKELYFAAGGKLSFAAPAAETGFDEYVADPMHPVPVVGYTALGMVQEYMVSDQRFASKRPDVLTYQTEVLEEDVTVTGPVEPRLHLQSTGTDADFVVKLIDVYPHEFPEPEGVTPGQYNVPMSGYQQLLRGEPFRAKFRKSMEKPEPLEPGKPFLIEYVMPDVAHVFRRGHRIMVQMQSSWFPLNDRNPQKFCDIPNARESDFVKATQRLYRTRAMPSHLVLPVL